MGFGKFLKKVAKGAVKATTLGAGVPLLKKKKKRKNVTAETAVRGRAIGRERSSGKTAAEVLRGRKSADEAVESEKPEKKYKISMA